MKNIKKVLTLLFLCSIVFPSFSSKIDQNIDTWMSLCEEYFVSTRNYYVSKEKSENESTEYSLISIFEKQFHIIINFSSSLFDEMEYMKQNSFKYHLNLFLSNANQDRIKNLKNYIPIMIQQFQASFAWGFDDLIPSNLYFYNDAKKNKSHIIENLNDMSKNLMLFLVLDKMLENIVISTSSASDGFDAFLGKITHSSIEDYNSLDRCTISFDQYINTANTQRKVTILHPLIRELLESKAKQNRMNIINTIFLEAQKKYKEFFIFPVILPLNKKFFNLKTPGAYEIKKYLLDYSENKKDSLTYKSFKIALDLHNISLEDFKAIVDYEASSGDTSNQCYIL